MDRRLCSCRRPTLSSACRWTRAVAYRWKSNWQQSPFHGRCAEVQERSLASSIFFFQFFFGSPWVSWLLCIVRWSIWQIFVKCSPSAIDVELKIEIYANFYFAISLFFHAAPFILWPLLERGSCITDAANDNDNIIINTNHRIVCQPSTPCVRPVLASCLFYPSSWSILVVTTLAS